MIRQLETKSAGRALWRGRFGGAFRGVPLVCGLALAACSAPVVDGDQDAATAAGDRVDELDRQVNTLLLAAQLGDERLGQLGSRTAIAPYARVGELATESLAVMSDLKLQPRPLDAAASGANELDRLSRLAAKVPVQVRRAKQALAAKGFSRSTHPEVYRSFDAVKLAAQSLATSVDEALLDREGGALSRLQADERRELETLSGPLLPGSSWYVLDEGHIDAIDVAYEDDELGVMIHDESVDPDVERDPAKTVLVVKRSAKVQVPDNRFPFLGPAGTNVWILPEGQPEAEAAGLLWPGIATEEVASGVFVGDTVDVRFANLVGPNGLSLFESPQDEISDPVLLMDSEDGLPDTLTTPVGTHRHMNWAFESAGIYLLRVQARGRLAELPGAPLVSSRAAVLKFVVLP